MKARTNNENIVVVYGSGASFGSGYKVKINGIYKTICPPTDQNFFNEINDDIFKEKYCALIQFKKAYFPSDSNPGMEEVWTALDLNFKHIKLASFNWTRQTENYLKEYLEKSEKLYENMDIASPSNKLVMDKPPKDYSKFKFLGDCGRDFRRLIYDIYSPYEILENDTNNFRELDRLLPKESNSDLNFIGYITFNYDCYLEDALTSIREFKYIDRNSYTEAKNRGDIPECLLHGGIPIVKLHGSLSWKEKLKGDFSKIDFHLPYSKESQIKPNYVDDYNWDQPAIIPPTIFKQEINDDSRIEHNLTQTILQQWRTAITMLESADKIIFVGYSFPISDFHTKRIFQISRMVRKQADKTIKILDCIGPEDDEKKKGEKKVEREKMLRNIFGSDTDIKVTNGFDKLMASSELKEFLGI